VLRTVIWLLRAGGYVAVGLGTFPHWAAGSATHVVSLTAYALSGVLMLAWALLDILGGPVARGSKRTLLVLGAIAVTTGAAGALPHSDSLIFITLIAVLDAGTEANPPAGWVVAACAVLAMETGALATGASGTVILGYPLMTVSVLVAGHNRRTYRVRAEQSAALLTQHQLLRTEQNRVAVLDERTRIAREIHDVLAHSLGALGIQIQAARALLTDHQDIDRAIEVLAGAQRMAADGLTETRRAVHALRVDIAPLDDELATMADTHRQRHDVPVRFRVEGEPVPLPVDHVLPLFRTAQEALTNAAKHAPAQPAEVTLTYEDDHVTLTVDNPLGDADLQRADDRLRFATVNGGYGLTGMRERLLLLDGTLNAGVKDGHWVVSARVPR
jgi:signal transduction histidine kinase